MGRKNDSVIAYTTEPIVPNPRPRPKIAPLIQFLSLIVGVFTAFKVLELDRKLTSVENKLDIKKDLETDEGRFSASMPESFTENI